MIETLVIHTYRNVTWHEIRCNLGVTCVHIHSGYWTTCPIFVQKSSRVEKVYYNFPKLRMPFSDKDTKLRHRESAAATQSMKCEKSFKLMYFCCGAGPVSSCLPTEHNDSEDHRGLERANFNGWPGSWLLVLKPSPGPAERGGLAQSYCWSLVFNPDIFKI